MLLQGENKMSLSGFQLSVEGIEALEEDGGNPDQALNAIHRNVGKPDTIKYMGTTDVDGITGYRFAVKNRRGRENCANQLKVDVFNGGRGYSARVEEMG